MIAVNVCRWFTAKVAVAGSKEIVASGFTSTEIDAALLASATGLAVIVTLSGEERPLGGW
jgi:hypothetical protein